MDRDKVQVNKNVKEEQGQYPAIIWSIKDLLNGQKRELFLARPTREMMDLSTPLGKPIRTHDFTIFILSLLEDSNV